MEDLYKTLEKYKKLNTVLSLEEERELLYRYVYATNKLEGNQLTLAQTTQLLSTDTITGDNVRTFDILEQKGMYKAVTRMLRAVREDEVLSVALLLELNWTALGHLWRYDDAYVDAKAKGQKEGEFKTSKNIIQIRQGAKTIERIEPLSTPENVVRNIYKLLQSVLESDKDVVIRAAFLAQELWLHQPFVDGNKRTGRLAINFLTLKAGFPLLVFDDSSGNYNSLLVEQYIDKKPGLIEEYIKNGLIKEMNRYLNLNQKTGNGSGFRMML